ncbi:glycosyltransferase family 32 protein [Bacteroides caecimuris]|uniref:glycosyltransferase family 32 protein n=1 Tax=Bacteroides caecimuris TaxID=1796613 RepID=UPI0025707ADD|nr:glycosyltransferase [Bacteroides caecimuris]
MRADLKQQEQGNRAMIPKIIHYCWFGGNPLPRSAQKCIDSWRKFFPGYEIKRWDESNYDVNVIPYTRDAYSAKKYAFVSDYARFDVLYREGGIYFDTDVEVIRSMDDIVEAGAFMGFETVKPGAHVMVAPGLGLGTEPGNPLYAGILEHYRSSLFLLKDSESNPVTVVTHATQILNEYGLKDDDKSIQTIRGIKIYPPEYFCPRSTIDGKLYLTDNTRSIHHYAQTWQSPVRKYGRRILLKLGGPKLINVLKPFLLTK